MKHTIAVLALLLSLLVFGMAAANAGNLDNKFLDCIKEELIPVSIYLVNGIKLQGQIGDYSDKVIVLKNSVDQMVSRNNITTIVPARNCSA